LREVANTVEPGHKAQKARLRVDSVLDPRLCEHEAPPHPGQCLERTSYSRFSLRRDLPVRHQNVVAGSSRRNLANLLDLFLEIRYVEKFVR
jgi:hypothetical protein